MTQPIPKPKTKRDPKYLKWIRTLPCCVCGSMYNVVAHHESILGRGMAIKPSDYESIPLCDDFTGCHKQRHGIGKRFYGGFDYKKEIIRNLIEYFGKE